MLVVVGALHLDVILKAPHLPVVDETVSGSAVTYRLGGKGCNQALAAHRLGAPVVLAGRAGSDPFGQMIRTALRNHGLDLSRVQTDPGPSGMSAAIVDANGDYGAVIVSAANLRIDADEIDLPDDTSLVLLQNEIPEAVNLTVARAARRIGARVWLNAAPARPVSSALMAALDVLIVNRVEAGAHGQVPPTVTVLTTLGADGVTLRGQTYDAFPVPVISTHGAGDMFIGALAARVLGGERLEAAIPYAQAAAALHVSQTPEENDAIDAEKVAGFLSSQLRR